jgi:hypothetical protein
MQALLDFNATQWCSNEQQQGASLIVSTEDALGMLREAGSQ